MWAWIAWTCPCMYTGVFTERALVFTPSYCWRSISCSSVEYFSDSLKSGARGAFAGSIFFITTSETMLRLSRSDTGSCLCDRSVVGNPSLCKPSLTRDCKRWTKWHRVAVNTCQSLYMNSSWLCCRALYKLAASPLVVLLSSFYTSG